MKESPSNVKSILKKLLRSHSVVNTSSAQVFTKTHKKRLFMRILRISPIYFWLIFFLLIAVTPFVISIFTSVKTKADLLEGVFKWPEVWNWSNYAKAWAFGKFNIYFLNSVIVTVPTVIGSVFVSILSGYALARMRFFLSGIIFALFFVGFMTPMQGYIIPLYYLLRSINLVDTYWALILPQVAMGGCFGSFFMSVSFRNVSQGIIDAARIDGCNSWIILWRILVPMVKPAIFTMAVLFFLWTWNDFMLALIMLQSVNLRTLPLGLAVFQSARQSNVPLTNAGSMIVAFPIIIIYLIFQRHFIHGLTAGAEKE